MMLHFALLPKLTDVPRRSPRSFLIFFSLRMENGKLYGTLQAKSMLSFLGVASFRSAPLYVARIVHGDC